MKRPLKYHRFVAESTLGRLAKWLRLAGFDTLYDPHTPDAIRLARICRMENRILLTRTRSVHYKMKANESLFILDNTPMDQVRQVIRELKLAPGAMRPLIRCACCNNRVQSIPKAGIYGCVPEHVLQHHTVFKKCPRCHRIYWKGSHASRWSAFMDQWFS